MTELIHQNNTPPFNHPSLIPPFQPLLQLQLDSLKQQATYINTIVALFQDDTMSFLRGFMGRVTTLHYQTTREKRLLEGELQKSRAVQATMRN